MKIDVVRMKPAYRKLKTNYDFNEIQLKYIKAIEDYKYCNKKVPTIRKIAEMVNVSSTATVEAMLNRLKEKDYDYTAL